MADNIIQNFDIWTDAQSLRSKGRVKSVDNISFEGLTRLRSLILELAVMGKLVDQESNDEPAYRLINKLVESKSSISKKEPIKKEKASRNISSEEKTFQLPENWAWARLGEIGSTNIGLTYSPKNISTSGLLVLRSSNIQNGEIDLSDSVRVNIEVKETVLVQEGDLLICARNGSRSLVGKCALIKSLSEPMAFGAFMAIYRSPLNSYIKVFLESPLYRKTLEDVTTTTINQITQDNLKNTLIPLPPDKEQKRIVAKVEELMALCDKLEKVQAKDLKTHNLLTKALLDSLTKAKDFDELQTAWNQISIHFDTLFCTEESIDQLKHAILQLAILGRLVQQDLSAEPANELLNKISKEKEKLIKEGKIKKIIKLPNISEEEIPQDSPKKWSFARLGDIVQVINGRAYKMNEMLSSGTPILRVGNLFTSKEWYYSNLELEPEKYIDNDDLIYAWSASFGPFIWKGGKVIYHYHIWKLDFYDSTSYNKMFMFLYLSAITQKIKASGNGIAMIHMTKERMEKMVLPVPPFEEQKRIVAKINELFKLCDSLQSKIRNTHDIKLSLSKAIVENALS